MKNPVSGVTDAVHGAVQGAVHGAVQGAVHGVVDGRSSRWTAHRVARRAELIDAAIIAITKYGAEVGMDQIAAEARTSKPVIYRYFADKTDLYRAVSQRVVGEVLAALASVMSQKPPPRQLLHAGVDAYLGLLENNPELYRFVAQHPLAPTGAVLGTDFSATVTELLAVQLAANLRDGGLDPALAHPWSEAIVGFISAASLWWLDHRDAMTRTQLADYLSALLWGGAAGVYQSAGQRVDPAPRPGVFPRLAD